MNPAVVVMASPVASHSCTEDSYEPLAISQQ